MDADNNKFIIDFLNKSQIVCLALNDLTGMLLPREIFFNDSIYKNLKEDIPKFGTL